MNKRKKVIICFCIWILVFIFAIFDLILFYKSQITKTETIETQEISNNLTPTISIDYEANNDDNTVQAILTSNVEMNLIEIEESEEYIEDTSFTLSEDLLTYTKDFDENVDNDYKITFITGESLDINIYVDSIKNDDDDEQDEEENTNTSSSNTTSSSSNSTSNSSSSNSSSNSSSSSSSTSSKSSSTNSSTSNSSNSSSSSSSSSKSSSSSSSSSISISNNNTTIDEDGNISNYPSYGEKYAILTISSISVNLPIYFGSSDDILKKGIGTYSGYYLPGEGGSILMMGHNWSNFLRRLGELETGDKIKITTNYGTYTYKVYKTKIIEETDWNSLPLQSDEEILMLYTCYPFDNTSYTTKRYVVYAK